MGSHEGEQPQTCPVCGRTFLNKNKLEKHLTIHTGERPHLCSICGNGFPSAASLNRQHMEGYMTDFHTSHMGKAQVLVTYFQGVMNVKRVISLIFIKNKNAYIY
uniref:C2H2-type domain-containing protein n=1 Tax=Amphilophus citrinellus TaxID=61819 RepID=A0A3Q0S5W5_AMPCI